MIKFILGLIFGIMLMCIIQINRIKEYEQYIAEMEKKEYEKLEGYDGGIHIPRID